MAFKEESQMQPHNEISGAENVEKCFGSAAGDISPCNVDPVIFIKDWYSVNSWWRHQIKAFSALLALCEHHKGQWRGALMFSVICAWTNGWVNNRDAGDLRPHRAHYDVTVMSMNYTFDYAMFSFVVVISSLSSVIHLFIFFAIPPWQL